jgi:carboxylesterase
MTTAALRATGWRDWLASAEQAFDRLAAEQPRIAVCGLSMGGLLTLELARRRAAQVAAIALFAAPLELMAGAERLCKLAKHLPLLRHWAVPAWAGADLRDKSMRLRYTAARGPIGMPITCVLSLSELMSHLRPRLGEVTAPALLVHSRGDHTVPFRCMEQIGGRLGSPSIRRLALER